MSYQPSKFEDVFGWKDPFWKSDPEGGRHKFEKLIIEEEGPEGPFPIIHKCKVCEYEIRQFDLRVTEKRKKGSPKPPLPCWGPHCNARIVRSVVES